MIRFIVKENITKAPFIILTILFVFFGTIIQFIDGSIGMLIYVLPTSILIMSTAAIVQSFPEIINHNRISLILSKSISRNEFLAQSLLAILITSYFYCFLGAFMIEFSVMLKTGHFDIYLFIVFLLYPLVLLFIHILNMAVLLKFNDSTFIFFVLFYVFYFSDVLINRNKYLQSAGIDYPATRYIVSVLFYIMPQIQSFQNMLVSIIKNHSFDLYLLPSIIISIIPTTLLLYIIANKKEF